MSRATTRRAAGRVPARVNPRREALPRNRHGRARGSCRAGSHGQGAVPETAGAETGRAHLRTATHSPAPDQGLAEGGCTSANLPGDHPGRRWADATSSSRGCDSDGRLLVAIAYEATRRAIPRRSSVPRGWFDRCDRKGKVIPAVKLVQARAAIPDLGTSSQIAGVMRRSAAARTRKRCSGGSREARICLVPALVNLCPRDGGPRLGSMELRGPFGGHMARGG